MLSSTLRLQTLVFVLPGAWIVPYLSPHPLKLVFTNVLQEAWFSARLGSRILWGSHTVSDSIPDVIPLGRDLIYGSVKSQYWTQAQINQKHCVISGFYGGQ